MVEARFVLGQLIITPGALEAFRRNREVPLPFLRRHVTGDWGEVDQEDWAANDASVVNTWRILSAYRLSDGTKIWVITEASRSSTCILLPQEY